MTLMLCSNAPSNRSTSWKLNTIFERLLYAFAHKGRLDSLVDIATVTSWTREKRWFGLRQRQRNNLCSKDSLPTLKPTQFSVQWISGVLRTPEVKRSENGPGHSPYIVPSVRMIGLLAHMSSEHPKRQFYLLHIWMGAWCRWLRHSATSRKDAGSILDWVTEIFHWNNFFARTVTLLSTQPLTEMSKRNISWWGGSKRGRCITLKAYPFSCADCFVIFDPHLPGIFRVCPRLSREMILYSHISNKKKHWNTRIIY